MNDTFKKNIGYITVDEITDEKWEMVRSIENKQAAISIPRRAGKSAAFKEIGRLASSSLGLRGPALTR